MTTLLDRDSAALAGLQKLRFSAVSVIGGRGARLFAEDGRELIDLSASWGAASLGYGHPALVSAVLRAVASPAGASVLSAVSGPAVALAERLLALFPAPHAQKVWLGHSGSDANETAIRAARRATGKQGIVSFSGAYHGCTLGTMAISGHAVLGGDKAAGLISLPYPRNAAEGETVLASLAARLPGESDLAACIFEPILSDGGLIVPPPGFLAGLDALCRAHGILTICDEVKVGLGRTGLTHAFQHEGFRPDILVLGKGLGGGLPLSAVIGPAEVMDCATAFAMQTLHGNPVCASAGLAVLDTLTAERLPERARDMGARLRAGLMALAQRHGCIGEIRGRGMVMGVEITRNGTPDRAATAQLVARAEQLGVVLYYVGAESNVLELTPPLTLSEDDLDEALARLGQAFGDLEAGRIPPDIAAPYAGW